MARVTFSEEKTRYRLKAVALVLALVMVTEILPRKWGSFDWGGWILAIITVSIFIVRPCAVLLMERRRTIKQGHKFDYYSLPKYMFILIPVFLLFLLLKLTWDVFRAVYLV
jgi:hypothetical protein